ncbi:MAG: hypothetical protein CVV47_02010 [Spirochaetae bacterium HGW-Spirochaetae-3]|jgi:hypothetical protein|nr:MAG: hypothetical protein CVV47_02010 [Spirochaetae bacterium HGW-Spirochaetae-3]
MRRASLRGLSLLAPEGEFSTLASRLDIDIRRYTPDPPELLTEDRYRESAVYRAIAEAAPDVLIVDLYWFPLEAFIRELPCKKVFIARQVDVSFFNLRFPDRDLRFRPDDYDLIIRTEPGFELPFPSVEIDPIIIRNRDEIMSADDARKDLGLGVDERTCLFAFNGVEGEGATAWKSFSYLEEEGWRVVRSDNRAGGLFPAVDWYNAFDMLVCGAGYSAFWEARYFGKEAFFVPFRRRFEDQARRVATCSDYAPKGNGADELVEMIMGL